jgi:16S rRNA U516 pseudouridylate synthase RsuA-like enzyme
MQPLLMHVHPTQTWLQIELAEGKNREIRNFLEEYGLVITRLVRVGYGSFSLGDLKPGEFREVPVGWGDVPGMIGWSQKKFVDLDKKKRVPN